MLNKIELKETAVGYQLLCNGVDISDKVISVSLNVKSGQRPTCVIEVPAGAVGFEFQSELEAIVRAHR